MTDNILDTYMHIDTYDDNVLDIILDEGVYDDHTIRIHKRHDVRRVSDDTMLNKRRPIRRRLDDNDINRYISSKKYVYKRVDNGSSKKHSRHNHVNGNSRGKTLASRVNRSTVTVNIDNTHNNKLLDSVVRSYCTPDNNIDWNKVDKQFFSYVGMDRCNISSCVYRSMHSSAEDTHTTEDNIYRISYCIYDCFEQDDDKIKVLVKCSDTYVLIKYTIQSKNNVRGKLNSGMDGRCDGIQVYSNRSLHDHGHVNADRSIEGSNHLVLHLSSAIILSNDIGSEMMERQEYYKNKFIRVINGTLKSDNNTKLAIYPKSEISFLKRMKERVEGNIRVFEEKMIDRFDER